MDNKRAVVALAALAQNSRLAVYRWLVECGPEGAYPGEISEKLGIAQATLSFHLKELSHAALVESEQSGRFVRYTADFTAMRALLDFLSDNCCGGNASRCAPKRVPAAILHQGRKNVASSLRLKK